MRLWHGILVTRYTDAVRKFGLPLNHLILEKFIIMQIKKG